MKIVPYKIDLDAYIASDNIVDYNDESISILSDTLWNQSKDKLEYIKRAYEYVRDNISHSADIDNDIITCTASEVLKERHGICFAKAHLLAALLRCRSIPAGFCYQLILADVADGIAPVLVYHGLNGVYIEECNKWIRLDARGNKQSINAQFSTEKEQLAFPIRCERGEKDGVVVYPDPDVKIVEKLRANKTRTELWNNLPTELAYNKG